MKNKNLKQRFTPKNSRRGMTIEMAILFMLVVVALSGLAASATIMQVNKIDRADERLEQRAVLDQIGESFCLLHGDYTPPDINGYEIESEGTTLRVYPKPREVDTKPVLTVELTLKDDRTYMVTKWSYGE